MSLFSEPFTVITLAAVGIHPQLISVNFIFQILDTESISDAVPKPFSF